jgi:hypothetical protein
MVMRRLMVFALLVVALATVDLGFSQTSSKAGVKNITVYKTPT